VNAPVGKHVDQTDYGALTEEVMALARLCRSVIDEESLYDLRVPRGRPLPYAPVAGPAEQVFAAGTTRLPLPDDDPALTQFIQQFGKARLCYGYPVLFYADGAIRPLFTTPVRIDGGAVVVDGPVSPRLNCGVLQDMGLSRDIVLHLSHALADDEQDFKLKLAKIAGEIGVDPARFAVDALEDLTPDTLSGRMQWLNRPVLTTVTMPPSRSLTMKELSTLADESRADRAGDTALVGLQAALPAPREDGTLPELKAPMVFDVHSLSQSQTQAVRAGMTNRLTAVSAPPGTGQMATIVNLIATAVMEGQSVLYAAVRPETSAAMTKHLNAWIGRQVRAIPFVGSAQRNRAASEVLGETLQELNREQSPAAADDEGEAAATREKPTLKGLQELDRLPSASEQSVAPLRAAHEAIREATEQERRLALDLPIAWTTPTARAAAGPGKATLAEWRSALQNGGAKGAGLGGMMKNLISRDDPRRDLIVEIRRGLGKLPEAVKEDVLGELSDEADDKEIMAVLARAGQFAEWKDLVERRMKAIQRLARERDSRSIELQAMNQAARKVSGVRELFRDFWRERLTDDPATLEKQTEAYFELVREWEAVQDAKHRAHRSQRLGQAVSVLASTLPVWTTTVDEVADAVPLEAACFDLVIIDEADACDLGNLLTVLYRGRRGAVFGAAYHHTRTTPLTAQRAGDLLSREKPLPDWAEPAMRTAIGNIEVMHAHRSGVINSLNDHFRSHPAIADYLSSTFYSGNLLIRTNFRRLKGSFQPAYLGMHWHHIDGRIELNGRGPINEAELVAALNLLKVWDDAGLFRMAPRPSVGVATPFHAQVEQLREGLKRGEYSDVLRDRVTVATPDVFLGRQVDLLMLLPGIAAGIPDGIYANLASSAPLFHDVVGAARVGVHVVGDRAACEEAGGFAGALAAFAGHAVIEDDEQDGYNDDFEQRFDSAFGDQEGEENDPWPILEQLLTAQGYPSQRNVTIGNDRLALRVIAPLGGRYNIELAKSSEQLRNLTELEREIERDQRVSEQGYHVLRLSLHEILTKSEMLVERLQRMV